MADNLADNFKNFRSVADNIGVEETHFCNHTRSTTKYKKKNW